MLFLNRRGFAGFVSCRACGQVIKCPHCDVTLTYHRNGKLRCHYCGYGRNFYKAVSDLQKLTCSRIWSWNRKGRGGTPCRVSDSQSSPYGYGYDKKKACP